MSYVYILKNSAMEGILKIGFTTRHVEERIQEINSATGVLHNFELVQAFKCREPFRVEQETHRILGKFRVAKNKEFFKISKDMALNAIENAIVKIEEDIFKYEKNKNVCISTFDVKDIGASIKKVRIVQGLSQLELAAASHTGTRFIRELEKGKASCHIGKVFDVMKALGMSIHFMYKE